MEAVHITALANKKPLKGEELACEILLVKIYNNNGESTPPCGTAAVTFNQFDELSLDVIVCWHPEKYEWKQSTAVDEMLTAREVCQEVCHT
ncbi:unnamed protein product [Euphydryas editha]|uniref:Uncharacterized protein n=1 Tax=Euphydryas editha TaxID=104508 RepID=A0AAU9V236_EUPED|nr:unnamed protein product [Euphydryas editha]